MSIGEPRRGAAAAAGAAGGGGATHDRDDDEGEWVSRHDADALDAALAAAAEQQQQQLETPTPTPPPRRELAVLGDTCAICLQALVDPALVRTCFHVFCLECLSAWVQTQALHGLARPTCPLCKACFDSALTNVASEYDYDEVRFTGGSSGAASSRRAREPSSTHQLQRRSLVYRRHMRLAKLNGEPVDTLPAPVKVRGEYDAWLRRELEACIGAELDLTVLVALIQCCLDKVPRSDVARGYGELEAALRPFLYEDAAVFARELAFFLGSRLNLDAYDSVLEYCCANSDECATGLCAGSHGS